jgi:RES domain-containing protein
MPDWSRARRWDAGAAIKEFPQQPWHGDAWRAHGSQFAATDSTGARLKTGRFHRAVDLFPDGPTWPVLYLALARDTCLAEVIRNATALPLRQYRITRLRVALEAVLDCRDVAAMGISLDQLLNDVNLDAPHALAAAAIARGAEAIMVPSATLLGDNLVLFIDQLRPGSIIEALDYVEPRLTKLGPMAVRSDPGSAAT